MDNTKILLLLRQLFAEMPEFNKAPPLTSNQHLWLARAERLVREIFGENGLEHDQFRTSIEDLQYTSSRTPATHKINAILCRAMADVEFHASPLVVGPEASFVPVGSPFDILIRVRQILSAAEHDCLIVDPYIDATVLTDFATLANCTVKIRILSDRNGTKSDSLSTVLSRWNEQHGMERPLDIRLTKARSLHDRLIIVDKDRTYLLSQSLKDFARRSPGTIIQADQSLTQLKIGAYEGLWGESKSILETNN
ncbi:hypothetical protein [Cupriavidus necator]|uniref:hypothetical protein n=1 Tax=Cupriavidus necator TaxID=106590 RepID=UPI0008A8E0C6|nr:hypothetical protein [Cupriavidus necator]